MDFNEFCENIDAIKSFDDNDRFEKYNQNIKNNAKKVQINEQNNGNFNNFDKKDNTFNEEDISKKIEKYKNMSQNELLGELIRETKNQKQNGNLDNQKLEDIKKSLSSVLTEEQQIKLTELINILR